MKLDELGIGNILTELSTDLLARYKAAAGKDYSKAHKKAWDPNTNPEESDSAMKHANKRFSGIVKATNKQFDNDGKKVYEAPKGTLHLVRFNYSDPSGKGIASGSIKLYAPDKDAAKRYALDDLSKYRKNVVIRSAQSLDGIK